MTTPPSRPYPGSVARRADSRAGMDPAEIDYTLPLRRRMADEWWTLRKLCSWYGVRGLILFVFYGSDRVRKLIGLEAVHPVPPRRPH
jgi:hypothetical protein